MDDGKMTESSLGDNGIGTKVLGLEDTQFVWFDLFSVFTFADNTSDCTFPAFVESCRVKLDVF